MSTFYAGLDVSDKTTSIALVDEKGGVVFETVVATTPVAIAAALKPYRRMLASVGQETGTKAAWLHKGLTKRRLPAVCLDALYAKKALSARRNKTDRTDARGLATLLARGIFTTAHVKSDDSLRIRLLLNVRNSLQRKALDLQTALRMSMKTFGIEPQIGRRRITMAGARATIVDANQYLSILLRASSNLMAEVAALDKVIVQTAKADPICRLLMTVPGVGPITALTFRAAVDDPCRFQSSRDVAAHFGLTPKRVQSGQSDFIGNITRQGDPSVRGALYNAACSLLNTSRSQCALRRWAVELATRKRFKVAAVACARKLAVVMHRMWITGEPFDPALS